MNLREAFQQLLDNYLIEKNNSFSNNFLAVHIRTSLTKIISSSIDNNDRYLVKGSAGQSNWANIPWVAILDKTVTVSPQEGIYIVYLMKGDASGIYLSINQGVTSLKEKYGKNVTNILSIKSSDYQQQINCSNKNYVKGEINLGATTKSSLSYLYQCGAILSVFYGKNELPSNNQLVQDLNIFVDLYLSLILKQNITEFKSIEEDEADLCFEDCTKLREHKRIERNQALVKKVKKLQGYKCKACGFDFEKKYGLIGKNFIEAHHLTPINEIKGKIIGLDPNKDFAVLCSNCHRMIHKTEFVDCVEEFRAEYIVKN